MKKHFFTLTIIAFIEIFIFISCKKENSCEGCINGNRPPVVNAGSDQVITLPVDSISLNGSASNDQDGTITVYQWTKISGSASFTIINSAAAITMVKNLVAGAYQFELKVTDNKGLSATDTMQVIVNDPSQPNRPPVANAGADQTFTLPIGAVSLDGSGSTDPDNNIISYQWTRISGPSSIIVVNPNLMQTQAVNLSTGIYQFELTATDAGNLSDKDTVQITINSQPPPPPPPPPCNNNWPNINSSLSLVGNLSEARSPGAGAAGNKIVFAGGWKQASSCCFSCGEITVGSSVVDIYDESYGSLQTHQLSKARLIGSSISVGNKIFFAGGTSWVFHPGIGEWDESFDNVDIYDASNNTWGVAHLSKARENIASAVIGNKIIFAGGSYYTGNFPNQFWDVSDVVDIYDLSTNSWSSTTLSIAREGIQSIVIADKVYFIGGYGNVANVSDVVDIYNNTTNTWSTSNFQTVVTTLSPPGGMGVIDRLYASGDNIIFCSGTSQVGIRNLTTGRTSIACITPRQPFYINNKLVFFDGTNQIDIYDPSSDTWYNGVSNPGIPSGIQFTIVQFNNSLYLGGGYIGTNGAACVFSDKIYKLSF